MVFSPLDRVEKALAKPRVIKRAESVISVQNLINDCQRAVTTLLSSRSEPGMSIFETDTDVKPVSRV